MKCAKEAEPGNMAAIHAMAKMFSNNILDAMETETENDCLIAQASAIKEIVEEAGAGLLQPESVTAFADKVLAFISQSENRLSENTKYEQEAQEGEEED